MIADSRRQTVAFRADASLEIGSGHVMRCLTLAEALKAQGAECHFVGGVDKGIDTDTEDDWKRAEFIWQAALYQ